MKNIDIYDPSQCSPIARNMAISELNKRLSQPDHIKPAKFWQSYEVRNKNLYSFLASGLKSWNDEITCTRYYWDAWFCRVVSEETKALIKRRKKEIKEWMEKTYSKSGYLKGSRWDY